MMTVDGKLIVVNVRVQIYDALNNLLIRANNFRKSVKFA